MRRIIRRIHLRDDAGTAEKKEPEGMSLYGVDLFGADASPKPGGPVAERFLFAPFSILDARAGEWQERKRAWLALGIKSEQGRDALPGGGGPNSVMRMASAGEEPGEHTTSIFDPVLCELAYRWFCPPGGQIVDPFAGGSVRGIVAQKMGRKYFGIELQPGQVDANRAQAMEMCDGDPPVWIVGDSLEMLPIAPTSDFVFTCPPYGDLEKYSDDERDLSGMDWQSFLSAYSLIIRKAVAGMRGDRFACFVVGDFRNKRGFYRNFIAETIFAFESAGAHFYNDAVLATAIGSASIRVSSQFSKSRKLAKTHQNVLVFCKGDPRKAAAACDG